MINLSDTTPTAITGGNNVHWQMDASGNVSAYSTERKLTVAPSSGVLTVDASLADVYLITVNAAVTSMTLTNPTDGQQLTLLWAQDTSGHAVTVASNLIGPGTVTTTASKRSCYTYTYDAGTNNWYQVGANGM
jgi:hypothetical protein